LSEESSSKNLISNLNQLLSSYVISLDEMKSICPSCAERMEKEGIEYITVPYDSIKDKASKRKLDV